MRIWALIIAAPIAVSAPLAAQDIPATPDESEEAVSDVAGVPTTAPIIVVGTQEDQKKVILGSRIPKEPTVKFVGIATNTGTRGLVPQSGMDQGATVRVIRQSKCTSDNPAIGRVAACILLDAQAAVELGDVNKAQDLLAYLTLTPDFTTEERLAGAEWQYRLASERGDTSSREIALDQMIETGGMQPADEIQARKALVTMALADGRRELAYQRLAGLDAIGQADAQAIANLAILARELDAGGDSSAMLRAIALKEEEGSPVPQGWRDFVAENPL